MKSPVFVNSEEKHKNSETQSDIDPENNEKGNEILRKKKKNLGIIRARNYYVLLHDIVRQISNVIQYYLVRGARVRHIRHISTNS